MKSILVELQCPYCGYKTHKKSEQFIVSQFESKFRNQILEDRFFHHECACCHRQLSFLHTCLYQDHQHHFIILLQTQKNDKIPEFEEDSHMIKRLVFSKEELQEKIHIFEDNLDDIVIECIKWKMKDKLKLLEHEEIHYHDLDKQSDTLWFEIYRPEIELVAISKSYYNNLQEKLQNKENEKIFKIVNIDTIKSFIDIC